MVRSYAEKYGVQLALVGVAVIWGGTFVLVADTVALYPMYAFLAWRFGVDVGVRGVLPAGSHAHR